MNQIITAAACGALVIFWKAIGLARRVAPRKPAPAGAGLSTEQRVDFVVISTKAITGQELSLDEFGRLRVYQAA